MIPPGNQAEGPQSIEVSGRELVGLLRPFVTAPDRPPSGTADGAPEVLPGLVTVIAAQMGDQLTFLPSRVIAELGGWDAVLELAMTNLRRLPPMSAASVRAVEGHADSVVHELRCADPFGASRICDLNGLLTTADVRLGAHGLLVAAPTWYVVLLHAITGPAVLVALELMAKAASAENESAPDHMRVSPDVFFIAPGGGVQRVAYGDGDDRIQINTTGLLGDVLFGHEGVLREFR